VKPIPNLVRQRRRVTIDAAMIFVVILLVVQMWLLTATLESYLAGHRDAALPGLLLSAILFGACFALYRFVSGIDAGGGDPRAE
jgi:hypothetical protein